MESFQSPLDPDEPAVRVERDEEAYRAGYARTMREVEVGRSMGWQPTERQLVVALTRSPTRYRPSRPALTSRTRFVREDVKAGCSVVGPQPSPCPRHRMTPVTCSPIPAMNDTILQGTLTALQCRRTGTDVD
jgi:hypothetical protein